MKLPGTLEALAHFRQIAEAIEGMNEEAAEDALPRYGLVRQQVGDSRQPDG
jgi:hypothetical protein